MEQHWLTRPAAIRRLWLFFVVILGVTVLAELGVRRAPHFAVERLFAFNALYGFVACAVLILIAKALGTVLKRPDTYYRGDAGE